MMNEIYLEGLTEEQNEEIIAEVEADESRCYKNDAKSLKRRITQRNEAMSKNEGFLTNKEELSRMKELSKEKKIRLPRVPKPKVKAFLKQKGNKSIRAKLNRDLRQQYVNGYFDEGANDCIA